jgi:hypothetical protein
MPIKGLGISLALASGSDQKTPLRRTNSQSKLLSLSSGSLALANEASEDPEAAVALAELDLRSRLKINVRALLHRAAPPFVSLLSFEMLTAFPNRHAGQNLFSHLGVYLSGQRDGFGQLRAVEGGARRDQQIFDRTLC